MADNSGRLDLVVGDIAQAGAEITEYLAAAAITKGDPVYLSADMTVTSAAAAQPCVGVAVKTTALGAMCPVCRRGVVKVTAGGIITRGATVYGSDASKRVVANAYAADILMVNNNLGYCLTAAGAAADLILIMVTK
jgi:predicted RecA/RadA family phage recombinase